MSRSGRRNLLSRQVPVIWLPRSCEWSLGNCTYIFPKARTTLAANSPLLTKMTTILRWMEGSGRQRAHSICWDLRILFCIILSIGSPVGTSSRSWRMISPFSQSKRSFRSLLWIRISGDHLALVCCGLWESGAIFHAILNNSFYCWYSRSSFFLSLVLYLIDFVLHQKSC